MKEQLAKIDRLEALLREGHTKDSSLTFQSFVDSARHNPSHSLYATAVAYNDLVYHLQTSWS